MKFEEIFDTKPGCCCKQRAFVVVNIAAAIGHLINALLTIFFANDKVYPIYETYASWTEGDTCVPGAFFVNSTRNFVVNPRDKTHTYSLSLYGLIITFHALSFFFQIFAGLKKCGYNYTDRVIDRGSNPLRFIEYSLSATIMLVCIALVSGIDEQYAILAIIALTFTTMLLGLIAEVLFDDRFVPKPLQYPATKIIPKQPVFDGEFTDYTDDRFVPKPTEVDKKEYRDKAKTAAFMRKVGWTAHLTGWVTMMSAYGGVLLRNYFFSIELSVEQNPDAKPQTWVTVAILIVFALYNVFGATQLLQLFCKLPPNKCGKDKQCQPQPGGTGKQWLNDLIENIYTVNSLVTKTLLGTLIIANLELPEFRQQC